MADQSTIRISKELNELQKASDLSLAVACRDIDVRNVKALIIGPHDTPYEFGFFEFSLKFNKDYPRKSPNVNALTTNAGRTRFNPNIYSNGKVCLSILGTWRGERGEEWSAAQGLESILLSIQSLMSGNPYENEPGFDNANEPNDKKNQKDYVQKIRHETLRISVIQRLEEYLHILADGSVSAQSAVEGDEEQVDMDEIDENAVPFEPFKDLCKRRFLWYYEGYLAALAKARNEVKDSQAFTRMPFEGSSNSMEGKFHYTDLERRLRIIKEVLDGETAGWADLGRQAIDQDTTIAVNLLRQYEQVIDWLKRNDVPHDVRLHDNNQFVWLVTYFGKPMTNLDGGLFRIKICFSPDFPDEQPRARVETRIFHHRIAADGTICYFPNAARREDVRSHIEAIFEALEDDQPPYDPRTLVNLEAHRLYWGTPDERKMYNRRLRRSAEQSLEDQ